MGRIKESLDDLYNVPDPYIIRVTDDLVLQEAWSANVEVPPEMFDFIKVMIASAKSGKYEPNNWLKKEGAINSDHKKMHESMFRHLASSQCGERFDKDNGLDPLLALAARAMMYYTRLQRGYHE